MLVPGMGDLSSKLWLIGEAPGSKEDQTGKPFQGGAGRTLDGILQKAKIDRTKTYVDNVIQTKPSKNDFGVFYSDKARTKPTGELLKAHERLRELVKSHRPNVVVVLGNEPLYALTGKKGIKSWRGSVLNFHGVKIIPAYHPAAVMRQIDLRPVSIQDLTLAAEESKTSDFPRPYKDNFIINPTYQEIMDKWIPFLHQQPHLTFDIETDIHRHNQIECVGFGWSKEDAICIPIFYGTKSWYSIEEELAVIIAMKELFASKNVKFTAQNAQFDMTILKDKWGVEVRNLHFDTMIGVHCLHPEMPKGLAYLASIYTRRPYYKDDSSGSAITRWTYNCRDCVTTFECHDGIIKDLKEFGTYDFYYKYSHPLIKPMMEMQRKGVLQDIEAREKIGENLEEDLIGLSERLSKAIGYEVNPNSSKQVCAFLYDDLKLPVQRDRKTKSITSKDEAIKKLQAKFPNPAFKLILEYRHVKKILSTYVRTPLDSDNRIRCSYLIHGTETGRLASRKSLYGTGTNLQNIPRGPLIRSLFIADPGYKFINADLSQAEARIVAYLSGETRLQALFEDPSVDVYIKLAALFFEKAYDAVTDAERQQLKAVVHASNYRGSSAALSKILECEETKAQQYLFHYYAMFPRIKTWHREIQDDLNYTRTLRTPLGRRRMFFARWDDALVRDGIAYKPQSVVADIMNYGIVRAYPNLPSDWYFVLQNHDAIMAEVPEDTAPEHIHRFFKHYFEYSVEINEQRITIPIDIKVGKSWGKMAKFKI